MQAEIYLPLRELSRFPWGGRWEKETLGAATDGARWPWVGEENLPLPPTWAQVHNKKEKKEKHTLRSLHVVSLHFTWVAPRKFTKFVFWTPKNASNFEKWVSWLSFSMHALLFASRGWRFLLYGDNFVDLSHFLSHNRVLQNMFLIV
jgi:hypothetical protein